MIGLAILQQWYLSVFLPPTHILNPLTLKVTSATWIPLSHHSQKVSPIQQLIPYDQSNVTRNLIYHTRFSTSDCISMTSAACIPLFHHLFHHPQKISSIQQLTPSGQRIVVPSLIYCTQFSASGCIITTGIHIPFNHLSPNAIMILCMRLAFGGIRGDIPNCK